MNSSIILSEIVVVVGERGLSEADGQRAAEDGDLAY